MSGLGDLGYLAHELRSWVAALELLADAARRPSLDADTRAAIVARALAAGRTIERLLVEPDPRSLRVESVDATALLASFARDGVQVHTDTEQVEVRADPVRLRQALANLIGNARRHAAGVVTVAVGVEPDSVVFTVADDGAGFPAGVDVFAEGVSGAGSTGLGLAIVRAIAEAHGGSVEARNPPQGGAEVRLVLPRGGGSS